jgi:feruloyl-CoA synthase
MTTMKYRDARLPRLETAVERRADGSLLLRCLNPLPEPVQASYSAFVRHWAEHRADALAMSERSGPDGAWRSLSWRQLWTQVQAAASALLEMGLGQDKPLMLLSGNSLEQAVVMLAAEYVGVPVAPVSPAYSLMSRDFDRLKAVAELVPPAAVFVQNAPDFARALAALSAHGAHVPVIAVHGAGEGQQAFTPLLERELTPARIAAIEAAHAAIRPEHLVRVLFTSGSTGAPKGVASDYAGVRYMLSFLSTLFGGLTGPQQPVFLDWLPWHHAFGLLVNLGRTMLTGAAHYIDDGKPLPGLFEKTVRNLREVSPSMFNSVPAAWSLLAAEMERDPVLARSLMARISSFGYGGASLPRDVWERVQRIAAETAGERIAFHSGLAATETNGGGCFFDGSFEDLGNIGVPVPGAEAKLLPLEGGDGRYEIRMRFGFKFAGYVKRPDLTAAAFDDEGYFLLGDAVRLVDPADPSKGLRFAGRTVEDFKLRNGTWVRTGAVRLSLVEQCAPLISDAVICGHDEDYLAALAWPNVAGIQRALPELAEVPPAELIKHPLVVAELAKRLGGGSASTSVARLMLMAEPPSIDANEISDKGYVNQATTRARRAAMVEQLFGAAAAAHVATAASGER